MNVQPLARQASLVVKELEDETLVYDLETDKAHCLNSTAARVWKSCDGHSTVTDIAEQLSSPGKPAVDESVVWLALDQLERFKLLDAAPGKARVLVWPDTPPNGGSPRHCCCCPAGDRFNCLAACISARITSTDSAWFLLRQS